MEAKPEDTSAEDSPEFVALRSLSQALDKRRRVSTSAIHVVRNDPSSTEFVVVEGRADAPTLQRLEESVSDLLVATTDPAGLRENSSYASNASVGKAGLVATPSAQSGASEVSIPSCTSSFDGPVDPEALRRAEDAIADLRDSGPAGLIELSSLSKAAGKPIHVWLSGRPDCLRVGRRRSGEAVDVEYQEPAPGDECGHWTLRGNAEPQGDVEAQLNDCLFAAVADQTGRPAPELRSATVELMRRNVKSLARRIEAIARLEKCDRVSLMIGGARYVGTRPQDAARVIDASQQGVCHPQGYQGHPRGHASHPDAQGPTESAENYSRTGRKSAFLSRVDQDCVGHLALQTRKAQDAMRRLNEGHTNEAIRVCVRELEPGALPQGVEFYNGQRGYEQPIRELVLVLRHHMGEQQNPDADVFVHTFYPVLGDCMCTVCSDKRRPGEK